VGKVITLRRSFSCSYLLAISASFGPDPYLNGEAAFETITGIQSVGVMACAKHFIANNQEHWRYGLIAEVDDRTMHEMYYYPFLRSIEVRRVCLLLEGMHAAA
jgi:beta-glucosidase